MLQISFDQFLHLDDRTLVAVWIEDINVIIDLWSTVAELLRLQENTHTKHEHFQSGLSCSSFHESSGLDDAPQLTISLQNKDGVVQRRDLLDVGSFRSHLGHLQTLVGCQHALPSLGFRLWTGKPSPRYSKLS